MVLLIFQSFQLQLHHQSARRSYYNHYRYYYCYYYYRQCQLLTRVLPRLSQLLSLFRRVGGKLANSDASGSCVSLVYLVAQPGASIRREDGASPSSSTKTRARNEPNINSRRQSKPNGELARDRTPTGSWPLRCILSAPKSKGKLARPDRRVL